MLYTYLHLLIYFKLTEHSIQRFIIYMLYTYTLIYFKPSIAFSGLYAHRAKSVAQPIVPLMTISVEFAILQRGDYSYENLVTFGQFLQLFI